MVDSRATTSRRNIGNRTPIVYQACREYLKAHPEIKRVLDYGSGRYTDHIEELIKEFPEVEFRCYDLKVVMSRYPHKYWDPSPRECGYDLVLASNVLNVQESVDQLQGVLLDLCEFGEKTIFNYPKEPRKMPDINLTDYFWNLKEIQKGVYETVYR